MNRIVAVVNRLFGILEGIHEFYPRERQISYTAFVNVDIAHYRLLQLKNFNVLS